MVFVLLYIHSDNPEFSEILGCFDSKEKAVNELLERANYREDKEGNLTQYMKVTNEYKSFSELKIQVMKDLELIDEDIYRISELFIE